MPSHRAQQTTATRRGRTLSAVAALAITLGTVFAGTAAFPDAPPRHQDVRAAAAPSSRPTVDRAAAAAASVVRPELALPAGSGAGRRIVFAIASQRVWLVDRGGSVATTYLVSGSRSDNLQPGSYRVYSRSRWAVGIDDSGVMQYFVRFAHGPHAAIGFHSIPTKHGHPLQTRAQLGTARSHGCIRQALPDAVRLWHFAPVGTRVVVVG